MPLASATTLVTRSFSGALGNGFMMALADVKMSDTSVAET
jgi:hypothetical protein